MLIICFFLSFGLLSPFVCCFPTFRSILHSIKHNFYILKIAFLGSNCTRIENQASIHLHILFIGIEAGCMLGRSPVYGRANWESYHFYNVLPFVTHLPPTGGIGDDRQLLPQNMLLDRFTVIFTVFLKLWFLCSLEFAAVNFNIELTLWSGKIWITCIRKYKCLALTNDFPKAWHFVSLNSSSEFSSLSQNIYTCVSGCNFQKNAVIDSLQEQVNNAKDKLLRLMSVSQTHKDQELDSSTTNLNSSSTQTTVLQFEGPSSSLPQRDADSLLSYSPLSPHPTDTVSSAVIPKSSDHPPAATSTTPIAVSSPLPADLSAGLPQRSTSVADTTGSEAAGSRKEGDLKQSTGEGTPLSPSIYVTSSPSPRSLNPAVETSGHHSGSITSQQELSVRLNGIISSEQLQEILQELSVDAATETSLRCPSQNHTLRIPSQFNFTETSPLSPLSLRTPHSPHPSVLLHYPSISPYAMRKRRPPFHSSRRGFPPPCFSPGLETAGWGRPRDNCLPQNPSKSICKASLHPKEVTADDARLQPDNNDLEAEEEEAAGHRAIRKCRKCVSRSPCEERARATSPHIEARGGDGQLSRHVRHSRGSWDSDSSSSSDYCYYHRPYCDSCLQLGSLLSSDSSSDSSDSEYGGYTSLYGSHHPVVFKDDLKPTFV